MAEASGREAVVVRLAILLTGGTGERCLLRYALLTAA
jgi:hypothetical protein